MSDCITLYADEGPKEQAARLHALAADPRTVYFADDDYDRPDLPDWPLPADVWVWSHGWERQLFPGSGGVWIATVAGFHEDDWWEGSDPEDVAARPDPWFRPISDVPTTGTLVYLNAAGQRQDVRRVTPNHHPGRKTTCH